jgi:hypothetical protein
MANGFSREVTDFDRQMGCMAGMFQIFDRRRLLTGRRRGGSPGTGNEPPPGTPRSGSSACVLLQTFRVNLFSQQECPVSSQGNLYYQGTG